MVMRVSECPSTFRRLLPIITTQCGECFHLWQSIKPPNIGKLEIEDSKLENLEFKNLNIENLKIKNLDIENLKIKNLKIDKLWV